MNSMPPSSTIRTTKGTTTRCPTIRNTPATTIVAAWIKAETGVGPSMASGNQIWKGNIADLPAPPAKIRTRAQVKAESPMKLTPWNLLIIEPSPASNSVKSNVPVK